MLHVKNGTADQIERIVVHASAAPPAVAEVETLEHIDAMHRASPRNWSMAGYHVFIRRNGTVEFGRPFGRVPAHVRGENRGSIGVCMAGGVDEDNNPIEGGGYSTEQWLALERVLKSLCLMFPEAVCLGHRDHAGVAKACPCFDVRDRFRHVRGINV